MSETPARDSASVRAALKKRKQKRAANSAQKRKEGEDLKDMGNDLFKKGDYEGAVILYSQAIERAGPKPVYLSNLSAAYIKLADYESAEWAATGALLYDPKLIKARYRRALARKEMNLLKAAMTDLEVILVHDPGCIEAQKLLDIVQNDWEAGDGIELEGGCSTDEQAWPSLHDVPWEDAEDSDSSDCQHHGNDIPCRFYNRGGCSRGSDCAYSHAPDDKSVRDELGRNVCLWFLLGKCKFGAKCVYSHSKEHLSRGWWNSPEQVAAGIVAAELLEQDIRDIRQLVRQDPRTRGFAETMGRAYVSDFLLEHTTFGPNPLHLPGTTAAAKANKQFILLISLEREDWLVSNNAHLLAAMRTKLNLVQALTPSVALSLLNSPDVAGVFITDGGITRRNNNKVASKLAEYVKNGGCAVFGAHFSGNVSKPAMEQLFHKHFNLPWTQGDYFRTTFTLNTSNDVVKKNPSLALSYSMKALQIGSIAPNDAIYKSTQSSRVQSMVFAPEPVYDPLQSPAVVTRVGNGSLGYVGDVNSEESSTKTILAMLSLLDTPKEPSTTPSSRSEHATSPHPKHPHGPAKGHGKKTHAPAKTFTGAPESQPQDSSAPTTTSVTQPPSKRFVLLLSIQDYDLFKNIHGHQIAAIRSKVNVKAAVTPQQAISHFASPDLAGIYLTDPGVIHHAQIMNQLEQYVKTGGLLVVGGIFSSFVRMDDIDKFFATFGLPWKRGSYQRNTFYRNDHHDTVRKNPSLASNFSMKALHVKSLPITAAMYMVEEEESSDESMFGEGEFFRHGKAEMKEFEAPVARTHVRDGYFGYIGDVNGEKEATNIVLSMLNLLDSPPPPPKPMSRKFVMILSFESAQNMEQHYSSFFTSLKSKVEVLHGLSSERVVDLLKSSDLVGIFVMSTSIVNDENAYLLSKLVEYSKGGGTLVFGGPFSSDITIYQMRPFFMDGWGLPWDMVCGTSKEVAANPNNELIKRNHSLLPTLYTKSLFITGMTPVSAVYTVKPPSHISSSAQLAPEAPIVYATVENGHIGFIGNFNLNKKETEVVLAMFRLLK